MKKIIAIDFDGTIHDGQYPHIGYPKKDVVDHINTLHMMGYYIIIWTCRDGKDLVNAINWLIENNIRFDRVNDNCPEHTQLFEGNNTRKIYADLYVDDKQVGGLPTWKSIFEYITDTIVIDK